MTAASETAIPVAVVAKPAVTTLPVAEATPVEAARPVVAAPPAVEAAPQALAATQVVATSATVAPSPEPLPAQRRSNHAGFAAAIQNAQAAASANANPRTPPPAVRREAHAAPEEDAMAHVLARRRGGETSDDPAVDRLNTLSLRAAQQGKTFSPRVMTASTLSARQTVTPPGQARLLSLP
jgi:hypothetical protein